MSSSETLTEAVTSEEISVPAGGGFVGRFGLDPWLLLAQAVNFLIVLVVLRRFVFRPLLNSLSERAAKVERGLADAAAAAKSRVAAAEEHERLISRAAGEATQIRRRAEEEAHQIREDLLRKAEAEAATTHDRAQRDAEELKRQAVRAAAGEVGGVVVAVAEKVLDTELTEKDRARYQERALRELTEVVR